MSELWERDAVMYLFWMIAAIGAIHVGTLAVADYDLVVDGLGLADPGVEELVKLAIGLGGAVNLLDLLLTIGEDS
jgi:uncharacterized membrane protein YuzA (DUF378 family)